MTFSEPAIAQAPSSSPSSRACSRKNRVYVFREFLLRTQDLRPGDAVLDVAGGKGDLSWLLTNVDGVTSVIADPRVSHSDHIVRSVRYLRAHPEQARERALPGLPTYQPLAALLPHIPVREDQWRQPRHLRILVNSELVEALREYRENHCWESWKGYWDRARTQALEAQPLGYAESNQLTEQQIVDAEQALDVFLQLTHIVGFHPDQATEAVVDLADVLGLPFTLVPCCVFPGEFRDRTDDQGNRVRTYKQLMDYLKRKNPQVQEDRLNFVFTEMAKDRVLYTKTSVVDTNPKETLDHKED